MIEHRADHDLIVTPATCVSNAWRVMLTCDRGHSRRLDPRLLFTAWDTDFADIFAKKTFRCRCDSTARTLLVERETSAGWFEVLKVER